MLNPVKPVHVEAVTDLEEGQRLDGWPGEQTTPSLAEVFGSIRTRPTGSFWHKLVAFLGPGYLVAVGYMDPGNWATSLAGGSKFGYALLSIALLSNVMAIILQVIAARLGVASGKDLAQCCRDFYPGWTRWPNWVAMELAVAATDLAEALGSAVALNLAAARGAYCTHAMIASTGTAAHAVVFIAQATASTRAALPTLPRSAQASARQVSAMTLPSDVV